MVKKHLGPDKVEILKDEIGPEGVENGEEEEAEEEEDSEEEDEAEEEEGEEGEGKEEDDDEDQAPNEIVEAFERWGVDPDEYFERA